MFIDLGSKIKNMQPSFIKKLGLCIYKTNVYTQKIDGSRLKTYKIVITLFYIDNKDGKSCFLKKTFLFTDIRMDVAFEMFFLILSNVKVDFNNRELGQRSYTECEAFSTIKQIELIRKTEFAAATFKPKDNLFIVYIVFLAISSQIYISRKV